MTPVLRSPRWLPVCQRIDFKTLLLVYEALNGSGTKCFSDLLPRYESTKPGEAAFSYYAPHIWNKLPENCTSASTLTSFKSRLKTFLYTTAFHWSNIVINILDFLFPWCLPLCFKCLFNVILHPWKVLWVALCLDCAIQKNVCVCVCSGRRAASLRARLWASCWIWPNTHWPSSSTRSSTGRLPSRAWTGSLYPPSASTETYRSVCVCVCVCVCVSPW